jgi:YD repeat-containing protein
MLTEGVLAEEVSALCEAAWARHHLLPKGLDRVWLESVEEMHQLKNSRDLQGCASKFARNHGGLAFLPPFSCTHARPSGWLRLPALAAPVAVAPQALSPAPVRQGGGAASTTRVITYTYDPLYRLTSAVYSGTLTNTYTYAYDAAGNRTAMTDTAGAHSYTYDDANRLTSVNSVTYT